MFVSSYTRKKRIVKRKENNQKQKDRECLPTKTTSSTTVQVFQYLLIEFHAVFHTVNIKKMHCFKYHQFKCVIRHM